VVRAEARIDVHPLIRLRVVDGELARRILERRDLGRRMIRAFLAEVGVAAGRDLALNNTRPCASIMALCRLLDRPDLGCPQ